MKDATVTTDYKSDGAIRRDEATVELIADPGEFPPIMLRVWDDELGRTAAAYLTPGNAVRVAETLLKAARKAGE